MAILKMGNIQRNDLVIQLNGVWHSRAGFVTQKSRLEIEKDTFTVCGSSHSSLDSTDQIPVISLGPRFCIQPLSAEAPISIIRLRMIIIKKEKQMIGSDKEQTDIRATEYLQRNLQSIPEQIHSSPSVLLKTYLSTK